MDRSMDWVHGVVHGPGPWVGPWTPVHVLYTSLLRVKFRLQTTDLLIVYPNISIIEC